MGASEKKIKRSYRLVLGAWPASNCASRTAAAPYRKQEAMNFCLGEIGIRLADLRKRCIQIGEKLGVFKDRPTSKGCISPYVPVWIAAVVGKK